MRFQGLLKVSVALSALTWPHAPAWCQVAGDDRRPATGEVAEEMAQDRAPAPEATQGPAADQTDASQSPFGDGTIVVTARKREENLQDTPIAISAFSANDLDVRKATDLTDLSGVAPNLSFESGSTFSGSSSTPTLFIRGIGQSDFVLTADPGVGVYVDGVYVARSVGSLFDLVDLERIEVLRGPQGTLFGRNTIGGAISLVSKAPVYHFGGKASLTVGTDELIEGKLSLNVPITGNLAARVSGFFRKQEGYVDALQYDNVKFGREEIWGGRVYARWEASDGIKIDLTADYSKDTSGPSAFYAAASLPDFPVVAGAPFRPVFNNVVSGNPASCNTATGQRTNPACFGSASILPGDPFQNNSLYFDRAGNIVLPKNPLQVYGVSGVVSIDIGDYAIKSITGWRGFSGSFNNDVDFSPHIVIHNINRRYKQEQFSQEIQLVGSLFDGAIDTVIGGYYFDEKATQQIDLLSSVAIANRFPSSPWFLADDRRADNKSLAGFAQATAHVFDERLHLTAGIRYTEDKKDYQTRTAVNPLVNPRTFLTGSQKIKEWTPMANVAFDVTSDVMIYGNYSEGFRDGGFPPRLIGTPTSIASFDPEFVEVYEFGIKSQLFDRALTLNAAYFNTSYRDIQVTALRSDLPPGTAPIAIDNLAAATIQGFEIEAQLRLGKRWRVDYSFGYLDNQIDDVAGGVLRSGAFLVTTANKLPYMPDMTSNLGVSHYLPFANGGEALFRIDWKHIGKQFLGLENITEQFQGSYNLVNATVTYTFPNDRFEIAAGVKNLTDEQYSSTSVLANDLAGGIARNINRPRTGFASLTAKF